ncbi:unnamed protein product [Paramecium sonneborni]|uniref:Uncharacterized protein n=1 Tax=Paramecium sonneborni TaxID=65129 RepID=A0A8S1M0U0_9CILI|nr:unnamed protein product [Paramecium sonneborni]
MRLNIYNQVINLGNSQSHENNYQLIYIMKIRFIQDKFDFLFIQKQTHIECKLRYDKILRLYSRQKIHRRQICVIIHLCQRRGLEDFQYFYTKTKEDLKEKLQIRIMYMEIFIKFDKGRMDIWIKMNFVDLLPGLNWYTLIKIQKKINLSNFIIQLNKLYLNSQSLLTEHDFEIFLKTALKQQDTDYLKLF